MPRDLAHVQTRIVKRPSASEKSLVFHAEAIQTPASCDGQIYKTCSNIHRYVQWGDGIKVQNITRLAYQWLLPLQPPEIAQPVYIGRDKTRNTMHCRRLRSQCPHATAEPGSGCAARQLQWLFGLRFEERVNHSHPILVARSQCHGADRQDACPQPYPRHEPKVPHLRQKQNRARLRLSFFTRPNAPRVLETNRIPRLDLDPTKKRIHHIRAVQPSVNSTNLTCFHQPACTILSCPYMSA